MDTMMKTMMAMVMAVMIAAVMTDMVQAAEPPPPGYCCPIHEQMGSPVCFYTYAELETHFATEHPATPIDIIWE